MKFKVLTLRFEHGASSEPVFTIAQELCMMADQLGLVTIINVNQLGDMFALPDEEPENVYERWQTTRKRESVDANGRSTMYTCEFCGAGSSKDLWGPGRITCPLCKKMARAADGTDRNEPR